jgi:putative signal transducing protein
MAYCPDCKSEYVEGVEKCPTCGTALLPGTAPEDNSKPEEFSTVCVRTFRGPTAAMEADVARKVLEEEGVPCILPGESAPESYPGVNLIQLMVREEDADEAAEILKDYFDSAHPVPPEGSSI